MVNTSVKKAKEIKKEWRGRVNIYSNQLVSNAVIPKLYCLSKTHKPRNQIEPFWYASTNYYLKRGFYEILKKTKNHLPLTRKK